MEEKSKAIARIGAAAGGLPLEMLESLADKLEFTAMLQAATAAQTGSEKERKEDKAS